MSYIIQATNISKTYPNINTAKNRFKSLVSLLFNKELTGGYEVLRDINLTVKKGESLAIIGKNGAGKSTLLKIISGVIRPTIGTVEVRGKIGALLELGSGFHPEYTGRENLKMSSALAGMKNSYIDKNIDAMIKFADIGDYIDQPVKNYSSGMVVRLGFAVVTVTNPELLITDEVLAVGDTDFQRKCIAWIDDYLKTGGTLLLVSHSIYHVQKLCKHAIWLENGTIKKQGNSFAVSQEYQSFYEKKQDDIVISGDKDTTNYHINKLQIFNTDNKEISLLETYDDLIVKVTVFSPDDRIPGLVLGIIRKDIPVYGTISDSHKPNPQKIRKKLYQFTITYKNLKLLPADYTIKAHAMDPECLRLMDEVATPFRVHSNTTDMGVVELETHWN
ncbi:Teichoic acid export ATP-binding protein TagH [hydrothermal vent metagenome]|uniref:Teichoic acid export ATP-binding protein TagH n=1 Tax=hydrothermal vent metagenome TaxID=652676 RepID=A0A3B0UV17_9ZZZZ